MKFAVNENKGFQITFDNGVLVSVQFGVINYCANYQHFILMDNFCLGQEMEERVWSCKDAEVFVKDTNNKDKWLTTEIFALAGLSIGNNISAANVGAEDLLRVLRVASRWHKWRKLKIFLLKHKIIR